MGDLSKVIGDIIFSKKITFSICTGEWIFNRLAQSAAVHTAVLSRAQRIAQAMRKVPCPSAHADSRCPHFPCSLNPLTLLIYHYLLNFMPQDCFWRQIMWQEILLDFREKDGKPFPAACLNCSGRNRDVGLEPQLHLNIYISLDSISFRFPHGAIYMLMNPRNNSWIKTRFLSKNHTDLEQSCVAASDSNTLKLKGINNIYHF